MVRDNVRDIRVGREGITGRRFGGDGSEWPAEPSLVAGSVVAARDSESPQVTRPLVAQQARLKMQLVV